MKYRLLHRKEAANLLEFRRCKVASGFSLRVSYMIGCNASYECIGAGVPQHAAAGQDAAGETPEESA